MLLLRLCSKLLRIRDIILGMEIAPPSIQRRWADLDFVA